VSVVISGASIQGVSYGNCRLDGYLRLRTTGQEGSSNVEDRADLDGWECLAGRFADSRIG
jgi:hypothetical protein